MPMLHLLLHRVIWLLTLPLVTLADTPVRLAVIERGSTGGFGVVCNSDNEVAALKGRAARDQLLHIGERIVSVDGDPLSDGERLIDRIRASPGRDSFTLGLVDSYEPPPPSLNQMMKTMMGSPAFRKMATKMVVGMTVGSGDQHQNLLGGTAAQGQIGGPSAPSAGPPTDAQVAVQQQQQLERARVEAHVEQQVARMLDSDAFGGLVDSVVDSPGVQRLVRQAEDGTLCAHAQSHAEVTRCLLDGGLLQTVTDATCAAAGVGENECREMHAAAEAMLARVGLHGDGWFGWMVRRWLLRPWQVNLLEFVVTALALTAAVALVRRRRRRYESQTASKRLLHALHAACPNGAIGLESEAALIAILGAARAQRGRVAQSLVVILDYDLTMSAAATSECHHMLRDSRAVPAAFRGEVRL